VPEPTPAHPARSAATSPARLSRCYRDFAIGSWANVFVIIWRYETTVASVIQVRKECERFGQLHPDGIFLLTIIDAKALAPPVAARSALAAFLKSASYVRASAVVMEGHSFRAAMVRGIVTGLTMLARQPFPHQVCTLEAAGQVFERTSRTAQQAFNSSEFARGIGELRASVARTPEA
jgi:hypothetical protein